jgi:hypothetical protein
MTVKDDFEKQSQEFESMEELAEQWRKLQMTAIVDDDYPEIRDQWELALAHFLRAVFENRGREFVLRMGGQK